MSDMARQPEPQDHPYGQSVSRLIDEFGKLPGIGKLFRVDGGSEDRTELMVLVIPYVVRTPEEAEELATKLAQPE